jgi:glycosyltransferase involved in cell wall biosynthesis
MKILHIAPTPFFADRGCHIRILGEIGALQAQGHDIMLTTYHIGKDVGNLRIERTMSIPWYKKLQAGPSWHKLYLDVLLLGTTIRVFLKEKPDIIHGHLHEGALIGSFISRLFSGGKTPVIFDVQGSLIGELKSYGFFGNSNLLKHLFCLLEKFACRFPDYFVCSSESNSAFMKSIMKVPPHRVVSIFDGIYPDFFTHAEDGTLKERIGIPNSKKVVVYTGSLTKSKGIDYFLDAIPKIAGNYRDTHFLVVGYPIWPSKKKVGDLKVGDLVYFAGKLDYFDLPKYLDIADVAVDPKVDETGEGSGKMINYMGAGLPVVCFDTSHNRAVLQGNGFFAKPGDSEDLADKILEALRNDSRAKACGQLNRERAHRHYSWVENGKKLSEIYMRAKNPISTKG